MNSDKKYARREVIKNVLAEVFTIGLGPVVRMVENLGSEALAAEKVELKLIDEQKDFSAKALGFFHKDLVEALRHHRPAGDDGHGDDDGYARPDMERNPRGRDFDDWRAVHGGVHVGAQPRCPSSAHKDFRTNDARDGAGKRPERG